MCVKIKRLSVKCLCVSILTETIIFMFNILISLYINHLFKLLVLHIAYGLTRLWDFHGIPWIPLPLPWSIRTPFPWKPWHGMSWLPLNAMEEVEFYRIPRKQWNLIWLRIDLNCWENGRWNFHFKSNIYQKCCKKAVVERRYKTNDNLMPN